MPTRVDFSPFFLKKAERLDRKYRGTYHEVEDLVQQLQNDARPGDLLQGVGYAAYKVQSDQPEN